jgi:gas vesicle protein
MSGTRGPNDQSRYSTGNPADTLRQAGQEARATASELGDQAKGAAGRLRDEAAGAMQDVKAEGRDVIEAARQRAGSFAEEQKRAGAEQAKGLAEATHRAADQLKDASPQLAQYVHEAASSIEGLARALRERSPGELIGQAEHLARRQPVAFFGAAVLAGFALARFARSSASHVEPERGRGARMYGGPSRGDIATPRTSAMGAPGWVPGKSGTTGLPDDMTVSPHPATGPAASLGGAAAQPADRGGPQGGTA